MFERHILRLQGALIAALAVAMITPAVAQVRQGPGFRQVAAPVVRKAPSLPKAAIAGVVSGVAIERVKGRGRDARSDGPRPGSRPDRPKPGHTPGQTTQDNGDGKPRPRPRPPVIVSVPDKPAACRNGQVRIAGQCACPKGSVERKGGCGTEVVTVPDQPKACRPGRVRIEGECACPSGTIERGSRCRPDVVVAPPVPLPVPPAAVAPEPPRVVVAPPTESTPPLTLAPAGDPPVSPPAPPSAPPSVPPVAQQSTPPGTTDLPERVPNEVLFTVANSAPTTLEDAVAQAFSLQVLERTTLRLLDVRLVRLFIPDGRMISQVTDALAADPRITLAQANYVYRRLADPAALPAGLKDLATTNIQYALAKVGVSDAHRLARGRGTRIAVIDSGVDQTHPDLAGAAIEEIDVSGDGVPTEALGGTPTDAATARPVDDHGTAVAGIIAARGTLTGVAPEARVLSARIFRKSAPTAEPSATTAGLLKGLDWAITMGSQVLNMSLAGPEDPLVGRAITAAASRRIITIAAAGNGGPAARPVYPAAYPEVIAVTAIDADDRLYEKANRGGYVAVAAPGVDVLVATRDRSHRFDSGTSFAAAHVSGIVALMLELDPGLGVDAVRDMLARSALDLGTSGRDEEFGAGRVDAAATLRRISAGPLATARK